MLADLQIKMEKVKQVLTHHLMLAVMVAVVVYMEKVLVVQEMVVMGEIETMVHKAEMLEVQTEVAVVHQEVMDMV